MLLSLLSAIAVAVIMVSTIRFWGHPPRKHRVWAATAIGSVLSVNVMLLGASASDQRSTLVYGTVAVVLLALWLLKTGRDYTKPSTLNTKIL